MDAKFIFKGKEVHFTNYSVPIHQEDKMLEQELGNGPVSKGISPPKLGDPNSISGPYRAEGENRFQQVILQRPRHTNIL